MSDTYNIDDLEFIGSDDDILDPTYYPDTDESNESESNESESSETDSETEIESDTSSIKE